MFQATGKWMSRSVSDSRTVSLLCGLAVGAGWVSINAIWWSAHEQLWPVQAAWGTAILIGLMILSWGWEQIARIPRFWRVGISSCGFAVWPTLWGGVDRLRAALPLRWFESDFTAFGGNLIQSLCLIFPFVILGGICAPMTASASRTQPRRHREFWTGVALAFVVLPTTLYSRWPADRVLMCVSALMLLGAGLSLFLRSNEDLPQASEPQFTYPELAGWSQLVTWLGIGIASSILLVIAQRSCEQLILSHLPLQMFGWAGFLTGMCWLKGVSTTDPDARLRRVLQVLAIVSVSLMWLYPIGVFLAVWSSGTVSAFPEIIVFKGAIPFVLLLPMGHLLAQLCRGLGTIRTLGISGLTWLIVSRETFPAAFVLIAITLASLALTLVWWPRTQWAGWFTNRGRSWRTLELSGYAMLGLLAVWGRSGMDLNRSSRLAFNGDAFRASAQGHDLSTIESSDRLRLISEINGPDEHWTIWRHRGNQLLVRRNGILVSTMTSDTELSPQSLWPVLATAVPLVVHPEANHVLCVAPQGLVEIDSILSFPIQSLHCVSKNSAERQVLEELARVSDRTVRLKDGRMSWQMTAPSDLAHSSDNATYDVIIVPDGVAAACGHWSQLTNDFHRGMARRLNEGGLYCQRFSIVDFGPTTVVSMLRSVRTAFRQVGIVTTDGSELLILASNSEEPLVDSSLVQRLETPHIRKLCAQLGGDWSMLTQLAYVTPESVQQMTGSGMTDNRCLTGNLSLRLLSDALRWGPKLRENHELFLNRATLLLVAMGLSEDAEQTLARRIQDSQARFKILTDSPDNQWAYRKELKDGLTNRPRTKIQRVNNEIRQTFDAYDQRRKDYFVALGQAARQEHPTRESIEAVENFAQPYDPLLTDFAHFEAAHLLARMQTRDPASEYRHWMYCVGYAPNPDRSIRPIVAALDLLNRNPSIVRDPEVRWEHHSFLLESMRTRWTNRWQKGTTSKYEAADQQVSVTTVSATLAAMDDLIDQAHIDADSWKVQRQVWEDTLLSPLRSHKTDSLAQNPLLESVRQKVQQRSTETSPQK